MFQGGRAGSVAVPGSGAFLDPWIRVKKHPEPGSGMSITDLIFENLSI
jgi:hypothetical protein